MKPLVRTVALTGLAALAGAGIIAAANNSIDGTSAPSPTHANTRPTTSSQPSTIPWTYQPDTHQPVDTQPAIDDLLNQATHTLIIDRWTDNGTLTDWSDTDTRLAELATPGLRVYFSEVPDTQTRALAQPGETLTSIDTTPATSTLTEWEGTATIHLDGEGGPRHIHIHIRCVPDTDRWRLDAWDVIQ